MDTLSSKSELDLKMVRVKETIPLLGKGVDNLLALLRKILTTNKYTQKIILEVGRPVYIEKLILAEEATPDQLEIPLHQVIRNKPMEELEIEPEDTPLGNLLRMFARVEEEGYQVSHALVAPESSFLRWLKLKRTTKTLFSVPVYRLADIPTDVLILCGAEVRDAGATGVEFSVKASHP